MSTDKNEGHYVTLNEIQPWPELVPELPALTIAEYGELKASIREHRQQHAILIDEAGRILDGNHRYQALIDLGIEQAYVERRLGLTYEGKRSLALDLNSARRQLTPEKKAEIREARRTLAFEMRQQGKSYRQIAEELGIDPKQARRDVAKAGGDMSPPEQVVGKDGKSYPSTRPEVDDPDWPRRAHEKHRMANGLPILLIYQVAIEAHHEVAYCALFDDAKRVSMHLFDEIAIDERNLEHGGQVEALLFDQEVFDELRSMTSLHLTLLADPRSNKLDRVLASVTESCELFRVDDVGEPGPDPEPAATPQPVEPVEASESEPEPPETPETKSNGAPAYITSSGDNGGSYEWYTPHHIIDRVRLVLGRYIGLDPASCEQAQTVVQALNYYTKEQNGLEQPWQCGTLYLNPPYGAEIGRWVEKLVAEHEAGNVILAVALLPNRTDTQWFQLLRDYPRCHIRGRLQFWGPGSNGNGATFPSVIVGVNVDLDQFAEAFNDLGDIYVRYVRGA